MSYRELNVQVFRSINDLGKHFDWLNPLMVVIADYTIYILALAVIIFLFSRKDRMMVAAGLAALIIAEIIGKLAGSLYSNHQPFAELSEVNQLIDKGVNNSFPSDHTMIFFTMAVSFWLFKRKQHYLWVLLALMVGISRVWTGVHYPGDVAAGALIGSAMAYLAYRIVPGMSMMKKWRKDASLPEDQGKGIEDLHS